MPFSQNHQISAFSCFSPQDVWRLWHNRLGHLHSKLLSLMLNTGSINENKISFSHISDECSVCKLGKNKVLPFPSKSTMASNCFDIIHSDVWGITPVISHTNFKYFVTFIDDLSRFTWVYFLHSKSEVFDAFQKFMAYVENQFSTRIKILRSDFGGEYMSHQFQTYLQK